MVLGRVFCPSFFLKNKAMRLLTAFSVLVLLAPFIILSCGPTKNQTIEDLEEKIHNLVQENRGLRAEKVDLIATNANLTKDVESKQNVIESLSARYITLEAANLKIDTLSELIAISEEILNEPEMRNAEAIFQQQNERFMGVYFGYAKLLGLLEAWKEVKSVKVPGDQ